MRPPKYPLEPLVEMRHKKVDEGAVRLAAAARGRDAAEQDRLASERRRHVHASAAEQARMQEKQALERGQLRVADLAHSDAWEVRVAAEQGALASDVDLACTREDRARAGEDRARDDLARFEAEAQLIGKDRARWNEAQQKGVELREEDASSEAWRPPKS